MVWCDLQLGPAGSPRPDVFAIYKSFASPCPTAYEVKVTRSDFLADVTAGKWQSYLRFAGAVYFAADRALGLTKADVPTHCGLLVRGESGAWRAAKRPVVNPVALPQDAFLKLLIDGVEREGGKVRARGWDHELRAVRKKCGEAVATYLNDRAMAEIQLDASRRTADRIIEEARQRAERIVAEATEKVINGLRGDLAEAVGLGREADLWRISQEVRRIKNGGLEPEVAQRHRTLTRRLREVLDSFGDETVIEALRG
jgi:hypothetical protein